MIYTSRLLNLLTFGNPCETLCSRLFRSWSHGSIIAGLLIILINWTFHRINGEKDHVFKSYKAGKK